METSQRILSALARPGRAERGRTAAELQAMLGVSQPTISRSLARLSKEGRIRPIDHGNAAQSWVLQEHAEIRVQYQQSPHPIQYQGPTPFDARFPLLLQVRDQASRQFLAATLPHLMADPSTGMQYRVEGDPIDLVVFGSIARGDHHARSDLDLAAIGCTPEQFLAIQASLHFHATRFILGRTPQVFHADNRSRRWSRELQTELVQDGVTVWTNHLLGVPWEHRA